MYRIMGTALVATASIVLLVALWRRRRKSDPISSVEEMSLCLRRFEVVPASREDIHWIAQLEAQVFSEADAIPEAVLGSWFDANPNGFWLIRTLTGRHNVGHVNILPIRPGMLKGLLKGEVTEREIRRDWLFRGYQREKVRDLYVESYVAVHRDCRPNPWAAVVPLVKYRTIVAAVCDSSRLQNVYSLAATEHGTQLLKRLGFALISEASGRRDRHDLYHIKWQELSQNISRCLRYRGVVDH